MARIRSNAKKVSVKIKKYAGKLSRVLLKDALFASLDEVGIVSVTKFMIPTTQGGAITQPPQDKKLTIRTGRLAGSIMGSFRFSETKLPSSVEKFKSGKFVSTNEGFEGGKTESIREVKVGFKKLEGIIGSRVFYAEEHEDSVRSYLEPAAKMAAPTIRDIFRETVEASWKGAKI